MKIKFILLLDEATSHIDAENFKNYLMKLINLIHKFGIQELINLFQVIDNKGFYIHLQ